VKDKPPSALPEASGPGADPLKGRKAVRTPSGGVAYVPTKPKATSVAGSRGCVTDDEGDVSPPVPGLRADRLPGNRLAVSITYRALPRKCRPSVVRVTIDVNDDGLAPASDVAPVRGLEQTLTLKIPERLRAADVVRASSETREGDSSESVSVLIRG